MHEKREKEYAELFEKIGEATALLNEIQKKNHYRN